MSMRTKAALLIMAIVFVFTVASFILSLAFTRQSMTEAMEHELRLALDIADRLVSTKIELLKSNVANISAYLLRVDSVEEMKRIMPSVLAEHPDFLSLTVLNQDGIIANYGFSVCAWEGYEKSYSLQKALLGEVDISTAHYDSENRHFVIHIFLPMGNDLVLSATIPAILLSDLISDFKLWHTGSIFIVDEESTIIANVRTDLVYARHNFIEEARVNPDVKDSGLFFQDMMGTDTGSGRYHLDGQERLCVYKRVSSTNVGWHIGVAAPIDESPMQDVQNSLLFASLIFLTIGVVVSISVSGAASRPFQKIQEQAVHIREQHERVRILLNATPLACRLWNKKYEIFECNDETVRLFELKDKQEYMERFFELSPEYQPDGQLSSEKTRNILDKVFEEGGCVYNWMHQLPDGRPLPAEITLVRVKYEGEDVIAGYTRDLREQEQMMSEIKYHGDLLGIMNRTAAILLQSDTDGFEQDLMDCMNMVANTIHVDRVYVWKNYEKDGELYSSQIYEWAGSSVSKHNQILTTDVLYDSKLPGWKEILSENKCINSLTSDMPQIIREQLTVQNILSILIVPVFLQDKFWGFVGFDNCHSEAAFTESEESILRNGSMLLANALQRHIIQKELQDAMIQTEKANNAKSDFLASMSHEMRTPLNAVIGLSELTLEDGGLKKEVEDNLEKIYGAGETLLSLVNDILDISKIEAGKLELIECEYEIPSLINDAVTNNIIRIIEKPIEFILNIQDDLPAKLYGDEMRIKQVLSNLLSNAFKYTRQGTVELGIKCVRQNDVVWLTAWVSDSGIGIKPEDIDNLFSDYAQMNLMSNRKIEGTGLGLPITKKMTELMGGTITVESEYGKGSTFTVKIRQKYVTDTVIGADVVKSLKSFHYSNHKWRKNAKFARIKLPYARVLVVDDNATNLDVAKGLMKPYGMKIDTVSSGQQAIDSMQLENVKYNAIFMDHMMPGMDGIEAAAKIREIGTAYAKNIPIIALTANAIAGNEKMFLNKGFQDFLSKPIDISRLDTVIRHWLRDKSFNKSIEIPDRRSAEPAFRDGSCPKRRFSDFQIDGIDLKAGLGRFGGDKNAYVQVLRSFIANTRNLLGSIKDVNKENLNDYSITVHGIKGSSRSICANLVGDIAEALEKAANKKDFEYVSEKAPYLEQTIIKLLADLDEMLIKLSAKIRKSKKPEPDKDILAKILEACKTYDMQTVEACIRELENHEYETGGELVHWLWENTQQFNVDKIIEKLG